jgi:hypothetical protein
MGLFSFKKTAIFKDEGPTLDWMKSNKGVL